MTSAKIIKDSISPLGHRLTTMEVTLHRFVLAEFNTHRVFSRNSASSRAIPVEKTLARVKSNAAYPLVFAAEQPGMQGGEELTGNSYYEAEELFMDVHDYTVQRIQDYIDKHPNKSLRLHKSLINRLLEPFMWHTIVVTSTEWQNFFAQRSHPAAQPEIRAASDLMQAAYEASVPVLTNPGQWHTPYVDDQDVDDALPYLIKHKDILCRMSVARCARVSTLNQDGKRSIEDDLALYDRLTTAQPPHASPLEHVATPWVSSDPYLRGNFDGWHQLRHLVL